MKGILCIVAAALFLPAPQSPLFAADSIYCGGRIVAVGDTAGSVIDRCGQPTYVLQREQKIVEGDYYSGTRTVTTVIIDDWTYNFGPERFQNRILLKNGKVLKIEDLDYGY